MGGNPNNGQNGEANRGGFGLHYVFLIIFFFYVLSPLLKPSPYFSLNLSSEYRFKVKTDILET
jgi:hypothetical protein